MVRRVFLFRPPQQQGQRQQHQESQHQLDCYPYTFSPLLLFTSNGYFDKGYSNYNAVAQFFRPVLQQVQQQQSQQQGEEGSESFPNVDMLHNVIYERKNMLYEDLLNHIIQHEVRLTETKIRKKSAAGLSFCFLVVAGCSFASCGVAKCRLSFPSSSAAAASKKHPYILTAHDLSCFTIIKSLTCCCLCRFSTFPIWSSFLSHPLHAARNSH